MHGGASSGPKSEQGRIRCAAAKTVHGQDSAAAKEQRKISTARLAVLEKIGRDLGFMGGQGTRGPKPTGMAEAYPELQAAAQKFKVSRPRNSKA